MTPSLSTSRAGLCGIRRGVERPLPGGEEPEREPPVNGGGRELMDRNRPRLSKLPLPTRFSISSARCSVFSFSSCMSLKNQEMINSFKQGDLT